MRSGGLRTKAFDATLPAFLEYEWQRDLRIKSMKKAAKKFKTWQRHYRNRTPFTHAGN